MLKHWMGVLRDQDRPGAPVSTEPSTSPDVRAPGLTEPEPATPAPAEPTPAAAAEPAAEPASAPATPPAEPAPAPTGVHDHLSTAQKDQMLALYQDTIREQSGQITELTSRLDKVEAGPPPTKDQAAQEYYTDPVGTLRKEIESAVAPLKEFVSGMQVDTEYTRLKSELKANPAYAGIAHLFDGGSLERFIDDAMRGQKPTAENIYAAAVGAAGAQALGQIGGQPAPANPAQPAPTGGPVDTPPSIPPSAPPAPAAPSAAPLRELTPNEERVRKEWGQTKEEFLAGQVAPTVGVSPLVLSDEDDNK